MADTIVVKIGSSSLTLNNGALSREQINFFADELAALQNSGYSVVLITSGSIAAGFAEIGYEKRPKLFHQRQASASVGQTLLMQTYYKAFGRHKIGIGQILLTPNDFARYEGLTGAKRTIDELLEHKFIPIINENDTVSCYVTELKETDTPEAKFADNDNLAALVAILTGAKQMIIITDTDGLYTEDPRHNPNASRIENVPEITDDILNLAGGAGSAVGTGGMHSKIVAAKKAVMGGVSVFIGKADLPGDVNAAVNGTGRGTYFQTDEQTLKLRKQWLGFHSPIKGQIVVDDGAVLALTHNGKSLLPAGVVAARGDFFEGDVVEVVDLCGKIVGRGKVNYSLVQICNIAGLSTADALSKLEKYRDIAPKPEIIHRDNWLSLL